MLDDKFTQLKQNTDEYTHLENRVAIVTGGTTGIGRAIALMLANEGAKVFIFGRHEQALTETLHQIQKANRQGYGMLGDVTDHNDVVAVFDKVQNELGGADILVNNASLAANRVEDYSFEEWDYIIRVNLLGYLDCFNLALKQMTNKGKGHIVNIGSMSADLREQGASLYVTAKSAIQGFSEATRREINERNIKLSLIEPGAVGTDMNKDPSYSQEAEQQKETMLKPEDIAECVRFCLKAPHRMSVITMQVRPNMQII